MLMHPIPGDCMAEQMLYNNVTCDPAEPFTHIFKMHPFDAPCLRALAKSCMGARVCQLLLRLCGPISHTKHSLVRGAAWPTDSNTSEANLGGLVMPSYTIACKTSTQPWTWVIPSAHQSASTFTPEIAVGMCPQVFPPTTNPMFCGITLYIPNSFQHQKNPHGENFLSTTTIAL
ncbi:hypothetical protein O181_004816 [Austropuccinia psidii MF-1]|uniref:Uncharacterized protein n=1 Tax=Austropuccinia psidii MF-1 TaxID=1389203 RepID=A0A9Q3GFD6_9BASI|nr:hypothetical protein [Austropuccinia psidii MF-1]